FLGGFHDGYGFSPGGLIAESERFGHSQIERQLHKTEMMSVASDFLCDPGNLCELHGVARACILTKTIPCSHAVELNPARGHCGFKVVKRVSHAGKKLHLWDFAELRFWIMQVENIHAIRAEIRQAARELVLQKPRGHAMASGGDVF